MPSKTYFWHQYGPTYSGTKKVFDQLASAKQGACAHYDKEYIAEYADKKLDGTWGKTVETFPLLQNDHLKTLTTLPDGRSFLPNRMMKHVRRMAAYVDYPVTEEEKKKSPNQPTFFMTAPERTPYRHRLTRCDHKK